MQSKFLATILTLGARTAPQAMAEPAGNRAILALSKTKHTLAVVDPLTLQVKARVPVGPDPHEVVPSADGKTAYVSNTGNEKFHEISVVDRDRVLQHQGRAEEFSVFDRPSRRGA